MTIEFDSGPLGWVKSEIDLALQQALENIAAFVAAPTDSTPLRFCRTHVHQVSGALAMVGLDGAQRFCAEIEHLTGALEKRKLDSSQTNLDILVRALNSLLTYLQELSDGAPDVPLKLFPQFKAMLNARGIAQVQESELFFPDIGHKAPSGLETVLPQEMPLQAYLTEQCQRYRRILVCWLRAPADEAALQEMREILMAVERSQALASEKTLWWAAAGLLETIPGQGVKLDPHLRHLFVRMERQLHYLSQGEVRPAGRLLRAVLYYVALGKPVSARMREIKQVFNLDHYLAVLATADSAPEKPAVATEDSSVFAALRADLVELKNCWNGASAGDIGQLADFSQRSEKVLGQAAVVGDEQLRQTLADIRDCALYLRERGTVPDALFSIEMATSLLMLEGTLSVAGKARKNELQALPAQTAAMRASLLGAPVSAPSPVRDSGQAENLLVLARVADEIRVNLRHVEQVLDQFFRDVETREQLQELPALFKQVAGALEMLDQSTAAEVIRHCQALVAQLARPGQVASEGEYELLAECVSALDFYLGQLLQGNAEAVHVIQALPARLRACLEDTRRQLAEVVSEVVNVAAPEAPSAILVDSAIDLELLDVYLTEAAEVLDTIAEHMQLLRVRGDDQEALVTLRRAFHTLKGSGRTVGLNAMGDVAWAVEQLLNQMLDMRASADQLVLDFIDEVAGYFQGWLQQLASNGLASVAFLSWQTRAEALRHHLTMIEAVSGAIVEANTRPAAKKAASKRPTSDDVVIGGKHSVPRELYAIFLQEAYANLERLFSIHAAARKQLATRPADAVRVAHTLAGAARTAGISVLAETCAALEAWLEKVEPRLHQLTDDELRLFDRALTSLQEMLLRTANRILPKPAPWMIGELKAATGGPLPGIEKIVLDLAAEEILAEQLPAAEATVQAEVKAGAETGAKTEFESENDTDSREMDRQLLDVFIEECHELLPVIGKQLREWSQAPEATVPRQSLQRALHTLKGSARTTGASVMGDALHELESQVAKALQKGAPGSRAYAGLLRQYDQISDLLLTLEQQADVTETAHEVEFTQLLEAGQPLQPITVTPMMRVRADVIDQLVNEAGEVSIARSRIERQMETFKQALLELTDSVIRLRGQLREAEIEAETQMQSRMSHIQETHEAFDPLEFDRYTRFQELTRMMAESAHDVATIQQGLLYNLNESEAALLEQSRMTRQLQQGLMRTRMVSFDNITERLHRIVRQTGIELSKDVLLELHGGNVEIDRSVLEKMVGALEHLLRNAVAHGLESPRQRAALHKPKSGRIDMRARQEGNEIILSVADDGHGLDDAKIKARATELGLLDANRQSHAGALMSLIFEPGFSTSDVVTQVSGRGVGLDAVRSDITSLGGRIEVVSENGKGCTFTIYLPLTLAVNQTVLVRTGQELFLLPAPIVEQVQKLKPEALAAAEQQGSVNWAGTSYPLHHLSRLLGRSLAPEPQPYMPVLLLHSGARRIAMVVDEVLGNREIVVKSIGPQLAGLSSLAGATVMGDGKVMLVLNPIQMAFRETYHAEAPPSALDAAQAEPVRMPTVMVVDDSLTMRKVITRLLTREGYHALTAKDGLDALQQLQSVLPDVLLLDIEMPRMNGFELTRAIRGDSRMAHLPIIVISSRTAEKHRNYAAELGVNVYLGKPYQEEQLLAHIAEFMNAQEVARPADIN